MPLFRSAFLKRAELSVPVFAICAEICVLIEETCRIMGTLLEKCGKNCHEGQRICKSCLMILTRFEEISLHCVDMDIF